MDYNIPIRGQSTYGYQFDISLSLDPTHLVYGYGYGEFGETFPAYFDIFSIDGDCVGYGSEAGKTGYQYGWGYEQTRYVSGDATDSIKITATVTDDGEVPDEPSGIPVMFSAGAGVILESTLVLTDSNGQAVTYARINARALRNIDIHGAENSEGPRPKYSGFAPVGYMRVNASIPKCMVKNDWKVYILTEAEQSFGEDSFSTVKVPTISTSIFAADQE